MVFLLSTDQLYCLWYVCQEISPSRIPIQHNTFMNPKVRAIGIRGTPEEEARVYNNWFAQEKPGEGQMSDVGGQRTEGPRDRGEESRVFFYDNAFGR